MIHMGWGGGRCFPGVSSISIKGENNMIFFIKTNECVREQNTELYDFLKN